LNWKEFLPTLTKHFFTGVGIIFTIATVGILLLSGIAFRNGINKCGEIVVETFSSILLLAMLFAIAFSIYEANKKGNSDEPTRKIS
jgi:heme/copper-type cytochrome/quinol oxidase subunit 3